ncbi:MAG: putative xanthine dehydrogenase subunit A [Fimbriimonadaceae bacterium]|nr:putative xanthine dehydrogenase subunit A [Fimbriimonadaceae bacterium]
MRDLGAGLQEWSAEGAKFALCVVVETWGSSPRPIGSAMAVRESGAFLGSVSGGCVESEVVHEAVQCLTKGHSRELVYEGFEPGQLWKAGLTCGGRVRIQVAPFSSSPDQRSLLSRALAERLPFQLVLCGEAGAAEWTVESDSDDEGSAGLGEPSVTVQSSGIRIRYPAPERLIIVGGGQIARHLIPMAREVGFEVLLVDPRSRFAEPSTSPRAPDHTSTRPPHEALCELCLTANDFAVVLAHDPKIDDPALEALLPSKVRYVGALGSRKTQDERRERLRSLGLTESEIGRIYGPVGLDIGAKSPAEIALSILAEIVSVRRKASP